MISYQPLLITYHVFNLSLHLYVIVDSAKQTNWISERCFSCGYVRYDWWSLVYAPVGAVFAAYAKRKDR
jgi:hypothetical protein